VRDEIKLKGSVLWGVINALEKGAGPDARTAILKDLDGELGEGVQTRSIIATGWYPIAWHRQLLGSVMRHGGPTAMRETVKLSTRENVSTIHRILVRMLSPDTLVKQGTRLFSSFFEAQAITTVEKPGYSKIEWTGCRGFDKNVWLAQTQSVEELVAMAGAKVKRRTVISGGTDLDDTMLLELVYAT
jgi:hypothetical protein